MQLYCASLKQIKINFFCFFLFAIDSIYYQIKIEIITIKIEKSLVLSCIYNNKLLIVSKHTQVLKKERFKYVIFLLKFLHI